MKLLEHKAKLCQFSPIIITVACTGTLTARHTQYYGKSILVAEEILAESFRLMKKRASITGFNTTLLKDGIDQLKYLGERSYERIPGNIGFEALKMAITGRITPSTAVGDAIDANNLYKTLSK